MKTKTPTPTQAQPATITSSQLSALSNLTERRLRQLAAENKLPEPTGGRWPMVETLQALFRHYQASAPELAKEKLRKLSAERRIKEIEAAKLSGHLLPRDEVVPALRNVSLHQRVVLQRKLETELPTILAGLDTVEIGQKMQQAVDEICEIFRLGIAKWVEAPPEPAPTDAQPAQPAP